MNNDTKAVCELCGEPMPEGETVFKFHGYSGPCPKPQFQKPKTETKVDQLRRALEGHAVRLMGPRSPFWQCSYCQALSQTPIRPFPHRPECLLAPEASDDRSAADANSNGEVNQCLTPHIDTNI